MLPSERYHNQEEALRVALDAFGLRTWTALPCIVIKFDPVQNTVDLKSAILGQSVDNEGAQTLEELPPLINVPVVTPRGGGKVFTFPIKEGDEALAIFASRCIDGWWANGGVQREPVFRNHDLSDGFAIVGPFSQATKITNWSTTAAQLRNIEGTAYVELDDNNNVNTVTPADVTAQVGGDMTATVTGDVSMTVSGSTTVNVTGNVTVTTSGDANISATGNVNVTGATINLN